MRYVYISFFTLCLSQIVLGQNTNPATGYLLSSDLKEPIVEAFITVEGSTVSVRPDQAGFFEIPIASKGNFILNITASGYVVKRMPIYFEGYRIELGNVFLERDITLDQTDNLVTLTDAEFFDEESTMVSSGLLQATRDVFLRRAAFDFSQAFFRVRGYDANNGMVMINGLNMNKSFDGRPQWNNWGGLNDVTRNQEYSNGLDRSPYTFGGILGNTNIDTRPSGMRSGFRLSASSSNRTYTDRVMATYVSPTKNKGLTYAISASRRWAKKGYIDGTLYDAYSVFGALEFKLDPKNSLLATAILASNRRGRSAAITEEVQGLVGNRYNPYWGTQNGDIRNSRERKIAEPILMLNHYYESDDFTLNTGISYQSGIHSKRRLGYYNAPNPDPIYYRYLPSYYINSPIGANFVSADMAKQGFLENPQIQWDEIYTANSNGKAAYILYDDVVENDQWTFNSVGNIKFSDYIEMDVGLTFKKSESDNYAKINDLLGADFHEDIDPFSNTANNLDGNPDRHTDDVFNYHYGLTADQWHSFAQLEYSHQKWRAFMAAQFTSAVYQRNGFFKNGRYSDNSLGESTSLAFSNFGYKGGLSYQITGRHWLSANGALIERPEVMQNAFVNPRENNDVVPDLQSETVTSATINYFLRLPKLTGRLTGFYTRFQHTTDINYFYVDAGVGSDFVQEVITDLDKLHMGVELGLEYAVSPAVKLSAVAAVGKYLYASDPNVTINFDTAGAEEELINQEGTIDLGIAKIKDYKLAQGPQKAIAIGIEYRDPKYWWVGATANQLANNYGSISMITRTPSFYIDPETGQAFPDATEENVARLVQQKRLDDFYLLNLVGGKSWLKKGKYISVFASINNVFDVVFRSGGYEQSRNGNYGQLKQDNLSGTPSFAPKYWYGYGRTYFLNVAYSF